MIVDKQGSPLTATENIKPDTRHGVILYVDDVSVSFDGFKALNDLNLYINDGELRCLIGASVGKMRTANNGWNKSAASARMPAKPAII